MGKSKVKKRGMKGMVLMIMHGCYCVCMCVMAPILECQHGLEKPRCIDNEHLAISKKS